MSWFSKTWQRVVVQAPLASLAFACLAGSLFGVSPGWFFGLVILALFLSRPDWRWRVLVLTLAACVAWRAGVIESRVMDSHAGIGSEFVEGTLTLGRLDSVFQTQRVGTLELENEAPLRVMVMRASEYQAGEVLRVKGTLFSPEPMRNPDEFSLLDYWKRKSVQRGFTVVDGEREGLQWQVAPIRWAENFREKLQEGISAGLEDDDAGRAVIQAMVLGEKPPAESEISEAFRNSGAMHVFAVSGLHVTLVGGIAWLVLVNLPIPRRVGVVVVLLVMMSYALVTGARPPAVRATLMAVCFLGAFVLRRRPSLFNALALSFGLVVLWDPGQVKEVGFQLSYGVLMAIGVGVGMALRVTGKIAEVDSFFPVRLLDAWQRRWLGVRNYFAALGATSIAAWVGSLPFMLWHFGIVTPISVFASLVLIPLTTTILGLAFLGAFLGMLWPELGKVSNRVNGLVASTAFYAAEGFASVPFGHWKEKNRSPADWVVFDPEDGGAASFLAVGNGAMIDVGSEKFYHRKLKSILRRWDAEVGVVALTHPDGDHVGGAHLLLDRGGLKRAILPTMNARSPGYLKFLSGAGSKGCELLIGGQSETYQLDSEVSLEIIREGQPEGRGIADNRIMVMRVQWKGWKVLIVGDLGVEDELALLDGGYDLKADVLLVGRHSHGNSLNLPFVRATGAKAVITSAANYPPFEKPPSQWLELVERAGIAVFNQADTGAVLMNFGEDELELRAFLDSEKFLLLTR
ncbi:ComEC/Rec2 family competence protein [Akkermansiaceae bacterium]|nr:ComEC/Rec2 family competence protein [Akkermansiaceae bacterium]